MATLEDAERSLIVVDTPGAPSFISAPQAQQNCSTHAFHLSRVTRRGREVPLCRLVHTQLIEFANRLTCRCRACAGLGETGSQAEAARQEVVKALAAAAQRGGRLAVAIVISAATPYSSADHAAVCSLVAHFGAELLKRALLVFTGDDLLASDGATLADYLADAPPDLQVRRRENCVQIPTLGQVRHLGLRLTPAAGYCSC